MNRNISYLYAFAGAAALVMLSFLVYGSTLNGQFVYDDGFQIVRNPWIRSVAFLDDIFTSHSFAFSNEGYMAVSYRPLVFVVFMIEYALFGLEPWGWHLVNIILHAANGVLLFLLIKKLFPAEVKGSFAALSAFICAALFVTLPVNSEPVSWVGCVPELVYTLFLLGAFHCYLLSREMGGSALYMALSVVLYAMAMFTKETAIIFPAFIFLYEAADRTGRVLSVENLKKYVLYSAAALVFLAVRLYAIGNVTPPEKVSASLTWFQYFINAFPLFIKYVRSLVLPVGNHPLQLFEPVLSLSEPKAFLSVIATVSFAVFLFVFRKKLRPVHALSLALIILPLLPVFYVPAVSRTPFADRYLYLPSAGLALALSLLFVRAGKTGAALFAVLCIIILANSVWAAKRSAVWIDERSLWTDAAAGSAGNYMAMHSLGLIDVREGRIDEGIEKLKTALKSNVESEEPDATTLVLTHKVLGMAYHKKGLLDEAVKEYNAVLRLAPEDSVANFNIGAVFQEKGFYSDAAEHYKIALMFARDPGQRKDVLRNLGSAYMALGLKNEALACYDEALALAPGDRDLINAVQKAGQER